MTNEEKKAIDFFRNRIKQCEDNANICDENDYNEEAEFLRNEKKYTETILNLLEKQDNRIKELEADNYECNNIIRDYIEDWKLKTKIIDLMAEQLKTPINSKKDVIEYFENLAKGSSEIDEG